MLGRAIFIAGAGLATALTIIGAPVAGVVALAVSLSIGLAVDRIYTIYGVEGEHLTPYMTRLVIGRLRLHIFWRGDRDPDPHDHPWGFWTFPLVTYMEEVTQVDEEATALMDWMGLEPGVLVSQRIVKRFRLHYRPATHTHRVIGAVRESTSPDSPVRTWEQTDKPIITIVWTERVSRKWGFFARCEGFFRWVPWRKYVYEGGNEAACAPIPGENRDD